MKILTIMFSLILLIAAEVSGEWVQTQKADLGYVDRKGSPVSIEGRKNVFGRDEFYHIGTLYPEFGRLKILQWFEFGNMIIAEVEGTPEEINIESAGVWKVNVTVNTVDRVKVDGVRIFQVVPTKIVPVDIDFKVVVLSEQGAADLIKSFQPNNGSIESGVTK